MACFGLALGSILFLGLQQAGAQSTQSLHQIAVPWLQSANWTPPWAGLHNDLEALAEQRGSVNGGHWVSLFVYSAATPRTYSAEENSFFRLMLNALYTYRVLGQADFDVVAALTPAALDTCLALRLPCYNATAFASNDLKLIGWAKFKLSRDLLRLGYHVHLSDMDVSYLKPVLPAAQEIFSWSNGAADVSAMEEEWVHQDRPEDPASRRPIYLLNTGVMLMRPTPRTANMLEAMLAWSGDKHQDQYVATLVGYQAWAPCSCEPECLLAASRGMAGVTKHPHQLAQGNCEVDPSFDPCDTRRLYLHAICRVRAVDKEAFLAYHKALFVKGARGPGQAGAAAIGQPDEAAIKAVGLPCPAPLQVAWVDHVYRSYTSSHGSGPRVIVSGEHVAWGGTTGEAGSGKKEERGKAKAKAKAGGGGRAHVAASKHLGGRRLRSRWSG